MLKHKLFAAFMALALLLGALSAVFGIWIIQRQVIGEAQKRVRLDLASAWAVMGSAQSEMETVLRLVADGPTLTDAARSGDWDRPALQERLSRIVQTYSFDFLTLCDSSGVSRRRADASRETGDDLSANPAVASARLGQSSFGLLRLDPDGLAREHGDLPARAAIPVRPTARARASTHDIEPRGLLLVGAVPVVENG
jgi:hypothetical protein